MVEGEFVTPKAAWLALERVWRFDVCYLNVWPMQSPGHQHIRIVII